MGILGLKTCVISARIVFEVSIWKLTKRPRHKVKEEEGEAFWEGDERMCAAPAAAASLSSVCLKSKRLLG